MDECVAPLVQCIGRLFLAGAVRSSTRVSATQSVGPMQQLLIRAVRVGLQMVLAALAWPRQFPRVFLISAAIARAWPFDQ